MKSKAQLIVGISGLTLTPEERACLLHPKIHGVILFSRNYATPEQLKALSHDIHTLPRAIVLKIYVDQEGGRVQRFRAGFKPLPPLAHITEEDASAWAERMAGELKQCGIDQSFAPVVDLDCGSRVIGDRAFSKQPEKVIACATAYIKGMEKERMIGILKHFPGHGSVTPDTHHEVAIDSRSLLEIEKTDLLPFIHFAKANVGMMVSHVIYPEVAPEPASLSKFWMSDYLRGKLGFKGPIFTDDLGMNAVSLKTKAEELVLKAFEAGADYALLCNDWNSVIATLARID